MIKKAWLAFYAEAQKNFEQFHVMDQLNRFRRFQQDVYKSIKNNDDFKLDQIMLDYTNAVEQYNDIFDDYHKFEEFYGSDVKNKTKDNAAV